MLDWNSRELLSSLSHNNFELEAALIVEHRWKRNNNLNKLKNEIEEEFTNSDEKAGVKVLL